MQPDKEWLRQRFIAATKPYITTEQARSKHSHYLHSVMFKRYTYDIIKADECLRTGELELLFTILWEAIRDTYLKEQEKAERMIREGTFTMTASAGDIIIKSEQSSREYNVNLTEGICSCPHGRKLSYAGLLCKHLMTVYSQLPTALVAQQITGRDTSTDISIVKPGVRRLNLG